MHFPSLFTTFLNCSTNLSRPFLQKSSGRVSKESIGQFLRSSSAKVMPVFGLTWRGKGSNLLVQGSEVLLDDICDLWACICTKKILPRQSALLCLLRSSDDARDFFNKLHRRSPTRRLLGRWKSCLTLGVGVPVGAGTLYFASYWRQDTTSYPE